MAAVPLIRLLADGAWHSGPELAARLGISRAAVWKRLRAAEALGVDIQRVPGRGYRLTRPFEPLEAERILGGLSPRAGAMLAGLAVHDSVDSTSTRLLEAGGSDCRACLAEHQTGGRGRRGRQWASPFGANLYLSVARSFDPAPAAVGTVSLAVGAALAETLHGLGARDVGLKWPNDLVAAHRKLGGILVEHRGEAAGGCRLVVGLGLNLDMTSAQAGPVDQPWVALSELLGARVCRNRVAARALEAVLRALQAYDRGGFDAFRSRWSRYDAIHGRAVEVDTAGGPVAGRAAGIGPDGGLLVEVDGEIRRFYAGDVRVRARA